MNKSNDFLKQMHEAEGYARIRKLKKKLDVTKHNIEISEEIIAQTPNNAESERLREKNTKRMHAVGSIGKQIKDTEETIKRRSKEVST